MITIQQFTFNGFQENTYILFDETKECVIIDPGCYDSYEKKVLQNFISEQKLVPKKLLNTHTHIDHILGNQFVSKTFNIGLEINKHDLEALHRTTEYGHLYGFSVEQSPEPINFLNEGDMVKFGNSELEILFTPGHSEGSICFYHRKQKFAISGDVLFYGSIGRTDLPGGDYETLIASIKEKLFPLGDDFKIYSGHGPSTTIGFERKYNSFLI